MTDQELNRKVAELMGYYYVDGTGEGCIENHGEPMKDLPDFCNDHNAAAEMRKAIREDERTQFARHVRGLIVTGNEDCRAAYYWSALAPRQQAEAFVALRGGGK